MKISRIVKLAHGLRFKLTVSYAIFFTLLAALAGALFHRNLSASLDDNLRDVLEQEWAAMKGYMRIVKGKHEWTHDRMDQEQAFITARLQRIFLLADKNGRILQSSEIYHKIGSDTQEYIAAIIESGQPDWRIRTSPSGVSYLIRSGVVLSNDNDHDRYYVAIGRSLADSNRVIERFTQTYAVAVPVLILLGCGFGWLLAGRALKPVTDVAQAAQRISGSNLSLRIPTRESGDELDYLIVTFNRMIGRLDAALRQARQFSTDVSHELRTPLTAMRGQLEVALLTAKDVEQLREAIIGSLEDMERLSQIVRALLLLSQAESGQLTLQKNRTDIVKAIKDIQEQFEFLAAEKGVQLTGDLPSACFADVDRVQFDRMVSNLLSNAVKYTDEGGSIQVTVRSNSGFVEIRVQDTGKGIAPEDLPYIFDRFYRASNKAPSMEKGFGLGLSFVAWITKAHGGHIEVQSQLGRGSIFKVTIPETAPEGRFREKSSDPVTQQPVSRSADV